MGAPPTLPLPPALAARVAFERGRELASKGKPEAAVEAYREAIIQNPDYAEAHNNLGNLMRDAGRSKEAEHYYRRAVDLRPAYGLAHLNLACLHHADGRHAKARAAYKKAIKARPDWAEPHYNLAILDKLAGDHAAAAAGFRRAVQADPTHGQSWNNMGLALRRLGRHREALAAHARAMAADSGNPRPRFNAGMVHLTLGDFEAGWPLYEARMEVDEVVRMAGLRTGPPRWRGEPIAGRTLLVEAEQGLGDTIQFVRYLPLLKSLPNAKGASVTLACDRAMLRLLSGFPGTDRLLEKPPARRPLPRGHHLTVSLMSLPAIFETTETAIPAQTPYLNVQPALTKQWATRIDGSGLKVGLVWAGRPQHENDRNRSLALTDLAPLAKIRGVSFYSLQKGPAEIELGTPPKGMKITALGGRFADFADTAAAIANLDLVITVDTAVAHLAGALGKPVWNLLSHVPDWRWMLQREDSPWYPTMRLIRQDAPGDWTTVIADVATSLRKHVSTANSTASKKTRTAPRPAAKSKSPLKTHAARKPKPKPNQKPKSKPTAKSRTKATRDSKRRGGK